MRNAGNYTHSVTSSQTQASRRNIKGFNRILPDIVRFLNCLKRNFGVDQNWNYATLLKIMVEISYNVNRAQVISHGKRCHVSL